MYLDKYSKRFCNRADARGNDMSERLQARAISLGKHARSKSEDFKQYKEDKSIVKDLPSYFEHKHVYPCPLHHTIFIGF
ncbi:hypothetical protein SCO01_02520 [Staphylococcus cohnii subsp. cohnii]|nr:hypothetical protein SCO01_02520 [Staphylococcus cohnii subsp. cohnii]